MLSFDFKIHILSKTVTERTNQKPLGSKEGVFRLLPKQGSLAVEAALVVPLFLFFALTLLSCLQLLQFSIRMQQILFEEGLLLSEKIYESKAQDETVAVSEMLSKLQGAEGIPVDGGIQGLDFGGCNLSDPEFTDLSVSYKAKLMFDPFGLFRRDFCQHVLFHRWIGYENGLNGREWEEDEVYVYITEDSEVYHRSRNCTHIRLAIREVTGSSVGDLKNVYGEHYKSCRHCHAKPTDAHIYITTDGDCYHNSLSCSGLSRCVRAIPLSQVGNRRPCSRCGY